MDVSVLLSVGSFAVSERVLKPKASVLVILGCVLAYDLTTKTHDVSALRVYRGPAMLAFTFMMAAWSLRVWRRNGVACDELLFLPGHPHGGDAVAGSAGLDGNAVNNEGDAAAGPSPRNSNLDTAASATMAPMLSENSHDNSVVTIELTTPSEAAAERVRLTSVDDEFDLYSDDQGDGDNNSTSTATGLTQRTPARADDNDDDNSDAPSRTGLERFQENHPRIVRVGSYFFFRTPDTTTDNAVYAPSGPSVFGAGLDLCMPVLINFHLFIESYNHIETDPTSEFTAKILPLIFLSVLIVRTVIPPGRRRRFWSTMRFTFMAPFHKVKFRDAFIGDILTSLVRPFQDILFALSYYGTVAYGIIAGSYGLAGAGKNLEQSWFLHNVVLPSAAILPLWWRFLQSLRAAYDHNKRWPYYGDSFKYLSAAVLILYGMTHPEGRRSAWWIVSFLLAILYQIWWDTMMDWELFVVVPRPESLDYENNYCCARISSLQPESTVLLTLHMYITQPISEQIRRVVAAIPSLDQIQLRPKRLYKKDWFYYRCFLLNASLRFLWMFCFIPAYRLTSISGETQKVTTFSSDVNTIFGVVMPIAEILRRAHWGFLKVEMETIRLMEADEHIYSHVEEEEEEDPDMEDQSKHDNRSTLVQSLPFWLDAPHQQQHNQPSSSRNRCSNFLQILEAIRSKLFVVELSLWAVAFVGLGYWATY